MKIERIYIIVSLLFYELWHNFEILEMAAI